MIGSIVACWLCRNASAARLSGVTATIIVLVPHEGSSERMLAARLSEVGWGVAVAVAVAWIVSRHGLARAAGPRP